MSSIDILVTINGKPLLWPSGFDELSLNQRVVAENYLRFVLKALEMKRSENQKNTKKPIGQILKDTAQEIRTCGPALANWLDSDKQRKFAREMQLRSALSQFLKETAQHGISVQPMTRKGWRRSASETMLWLVYRHAGLAQALLVICAYSTKKLGDYTFEEIIFIFEYVVQNRESLYCEALGTEAKKMLGKFSPLRRHQVVS
jgi:hypothetical protein